MRMILLLLMDEESNTSPSASVSNYTLMSSATTSSP